MDLFAIAIRQKYASLNPTVTITQEAPAVTMTAATADDLFAALPSAPPTTVSVSGGAVYRITPSVGTGRLQGKVVIVTGSAQGFGEGIAAELLRHGCHMVYADLNLEMATNNATNANNTYGAGTAIAISCDVTNEASVEALTEQTVAHFGGLDMFVSNAGVLISGSLEDMTLKSFDLVTNVNYTAFFVCSKYASRVMRHQHHFNPTATADIIQINSKSGLEGSNKNFAYAGSKFGGVGLVQSFAKELVEYGIKVNAICPGNFFEGPLWMHPEKGLFVQYLNAGKVPNAKTMEDVKRFYESKVPMNRGCIPVDVARAILYCAEQAYETGQAIPVTGGQNMLH